VSALVDAIARAKARGELGQLVDAIPYARFIGMSVTLEDDRLVARMVPLDRNIGNAALPALHGGTIGALLESVAIFELVWRLETARLPRTINVTVDYLRSGKPVDTFARAEIARQGRRVANVDAIAWQDDPESPIARAFGHFLL
jgi:uncharacterized protein (TIGR00369 family)